MSLAFEKQRKPIHAQRKPAGAPMQQHEEEASCQCWKERGLSIDRAAYDRAQDKAEHGIERRARAHESLMSDLDNGNGEEVRHKRAQANLPDRKILWIDAKNILEHMGGCF